MEALQSRPEVLDFLENVVNEQNIKSYEIIDVQTNEKGEGFLGQIFMVTVKNKLDGSELSFVIKAAFVSEQLRKAVLIKDSFLNEIVFYTRVCPAFARLEDDNGVSSNQLFPKCYKTCSEEVKEMLCLNNLKKLGFEVFPKREILDDEHISFIFQNYGRFHAYSFALKSQRPEEFAQVSSKLSNLYAGFVTNPDGKFDEFMLKTSARISGYLKPGEDDELIEGFKKYLENGLIEHFYKIVTEDCKYSAILHGDCWSNNMMFKYELKNTTRKLVDLRLIDFQLSKIGSPVCDLAYCLYSGADKSIFDNLDKYLNIYYENFSDTLSQFGCSAQELYPFNALKEDWKKYSAFGMMMGSAILQIKTTKQEDVKDIADFIENENVENKFDEEVYEKRIKELLYHLLEIGAL